MNGCLFCHQHREITPEDHKNRWFRKFILASDGKPFLYTYDEYKKTRILGDLNDSIIHLTEDDIQRIPNRNKYMDIYLLLFENGYITLTNNNSALYNRCLLYLSQFLYRSNTSDFLPLSPLAKKIREILLLQDATHLHFFLHFLPKFQADPSFQGDRLKTRMDSIAAFLMSLLDSDAAKQLSWQPIQETLLGCFTIKSPMTEFLQDIYLPALKVLNKTVKQAQKSRTNTFKEDLMIVCWHPDRFVDYCLDEEEKAEMKSLE